MTDDCTFTFAEVVAALARVNEITDSNMSAFRSRLQNFQYIGLVSVSPGKGKKIKYSLSDVMTWAFALELTQFGVAPQLVKDTLWRYPQLIVALSQQPNEKALVWFSPQVLSANSNKLDFSIETAPIVGGADLEWKRRGAVNLVGLHLSVKEELRKEISGRPPQPLRRPD